MVPLVVLFVALPVGVALLLLAHRAWARRKRTTQPTVSDVRATVPDDGIRLAAGSASQSVRASLVGSYAFVGIGTYGLNQMSRTLTLLAQCGLDGMVGAIGAFEYDQQALASFRARLPEVFYDRLVEGRHRSFGGGMANKGTEHVLERIDLWGMPTVEAARELIDRQLRVNKARSPGLICLFDGTGGQSPVGIPVLSELREEFENTLMVGFSALPIHMRLRNRFPTIKAAYEKQGVAGWVLTDNLGEDPVTADYGGVGVLVGLAEAALHADHATQPNNALSLALAEAPGGMLAHQVVSRRVVAFPIEKQNASAGYFTYEDAVFTQMIKGLRALDAGEGVWSADVPIGDPTTSTFDMVLANLRHPDLQRMADTVTASRALRERFSGALSNGNGGSPQQNTRLRIPNYERVFSSVAAPIDADKPTATLTFIRLATITPADDRIDELIEPPSERPQRQVEASPLAYTTPIATPAPVEHAS